MNLKPLKEDIPPTNHTIASHIDTSATGAQLDILVGGDDAARAFLGLGMGDSPVFGGVQLLDGGSIGVTSGNLRIDSDGVVRIYPEAAGAAIQVIYNGDTVYEMDTFGKPYWYMPGIGLVEYSNPGGFPGMIIYTEVEEELVNRFNFYNLGTYFRASYNADGATGALNIIQGGKVGIGVVVSDYMFEVGGTFKATQLHVDDDNTYIDKDGSNNMTFTDAVVGTRTLKQLGCPTYKYIKATTQSEGDLHLSDATYWAISKALIKYIRVITSSTNWDLYILQNDNGYSTDDANILKMKIADGVMGNANLWLDLPYEDEDDSGEVHLYFLDHTGANTADFYIIGEELL